MKLLFFLIWLYLIWLGLGYITKHLHKYNIPIKYGGVYLFEFLFRTTLVGVILARLFWIFQNYSKEIGWWFFPYIRTSSGISWFYFYPWRFLRFDEGINLIIFKGFIIVLFLIRILVPFFKHILSLISAGHRKVGWLLLLLLVGLSGFFVVGVIYF